MVGLCASANAVVAVTSDKAVAARSVRFVDIRYSSLLDVVEER
jgi:hypothetical protein